MKLTRSLAMAPARLLPSISVFFLLVLLPSAVQENEQPNVCVCVNFKKDDTPTMQQLTDLNVPEKGIRIRIMEEIGTKYDTVGTFLLNDERGTKIPTIKHDRHLTDDVLFEIMRRWLNSGELTTWAVLVKYLKLSKLVVLAEKIEAVLQYCVNKSVDLECPSENFYVTSIGSWNLMMVVTSVLIPAVLGVTVLFKCFVKPKTPSPITQHGHTSITQPDPPSNVQHDPPSISQPVPPSIVQHDPPSTSQPVPPSIGQPGPPSITQLDPPSIAHPGPPSITEHAPSSIGQPDPPSITQLDSPSIAQPDPPSITEHAPSSIAQPDPPSIAQLDPPSIAQPNPPSIAQPDPPSITRPVPPSIVQPAAPSIAHPDPPSITEPVPPSITKPVPPSILQPSAPTIAHPGSPSITEPGPSLIVQHGHPSIAQLGPASITQPVPPSIVQPGATSIAHPGPPSITEPVPPSIVHPSAPSIAHPGPPSITEPPPSLIAQHGPSSIVQPDSPSIAQLGPASITHPVPPSLVQPGATSIAEPGPSSITQLGPASITHPVPPSLVQTGPPSITELGPSSITQLGPASITHPVPPSIVQPGAPSIAHPGLPSITKSGSLSIAHPGPPSNIQPGNFPNIQPFLPLVTKEKSYTTYLKELYQRMIDQCPVNKDDWPPPVVKTFFRLAMILEKSVYRYGISDEFIKMSITGKQDDIMKKKTPIKLKAISDKMKECDGKIFLLEGAPGCGKSTLALHISQQWEEGKLFQEYDYVVLVRLRDPAVIHADKLADILPKENEKMGREMEQELISNEGQCSLLILDGWDEIPVTAKGRSLIMDILSKNKLRKTSVIITSRPTASATLYNHANFRIEVLGFTKEELMCYFAKCLGNEVERAKLLIQRIQENPAVAASCYIPLNASILVHVFMATKQLPNTQFGIFSSLIRNCIYRHQKKSNTPISAIKSLDKLPKQVEGQFRELCRLAYEGIMEDRIIFEDLGRDFNTLGLLQGVESLTDGGKSLSHNFLHLSIQELLAALHMATQLKSEQQIANFRELFGRPRFAAVFSFYSAHTKLKTTGMDQVLVEAVKKCLEDKHVLELTPYPDSEGSGSYDSDAGSESAKKPKPLLLSLMACLYEAEDKELYETVVKEFTDSELDLSNISLTVYDCLISGNFIAHCKQFDVDLGSCSIHDEGCKTLFRPDAKYDIKSLDLTSNSIGDEGAVAISEAMKTMTNLKALDLADNSIGDEGAVAILEAMKTMTNLQTLYLSDNSIVDEGAVAISEAMKTMTNLQVLILGDNSIGDEGAVAVSEAMKTMTNLKELDLSDSSIGDKGAVAISEAMKTMTNLQTLILYNNSIGDEGAVAISEAMKTMTNLQGLSLGRNSIGDEGAVAISEAMKTMTNLKTLDLWDNDAITEVGREALEEAAKLSGTKIWWESD